MSPRKYLVLLCIVIFGACGDVSLARGMRDVGPVTFSRLGELVGAIFTPWVGLGILLLIGFFASYLAALSWADLTYVLPATSVGYILMALLARFFLHENVPATRWLGIGLIVAGVGFIAGGPANSNARHAAAEAQLQTAEGRQ